jgi:pentapeptide MXKDX repeat protein
MKSVMSLAETMVKIDHMGSVNDSKPGSKQAGADTLGTCASGRYWGQASLTTEMFMKKILIATAALSLMCGSALAQTNTGPAAQQDNMTKPGSTSSSMDKGSMDKGTTGMNDGMKKDGMSGNMKKEGNMSKDGSPSGDTMKKN